MLIWCGSTSTFRPLGGFLIKRRLSAKKNLKAHIDVGQIPLVHIASFVYVAFFAQRTILLSFAARRLVSPALYIATREKVHTSHFSY